jgi:hypothetical protein
MSERMRDDLSLFGASLRREAEELRETAYRMVNQHPYASLGAAFGVGFLLAGGLFSRTTARTLSLGTRFLVERLLRSALFSVGASLLAFDEPSRAAGTRDESTP